MRWRAIVLVAVALLAGAASPAWAAPATEVVQGRVLRIVSVADWAAASSMRPGHPVQWDLAVSANAPDPGSVTLGVSATGDAPLLVDAALCAQEWQGGVCDGGAVALRTAWEIPRDGTEVDLTEMADTDVAHIRLMIALAPGGEGSTSIRFHARGESEALTAGPGGALAGTGISPMGVWISVGTVALLLGLALVVVRSRRRHPSLPASTAPEGASAGGRT